MTMPNGDTEERLTTAILVRSTTNVCYLLTHIRYITFEIMADAKSSQLGR